MIETLGIIAKKQTESNQARVIAEPAGSMAMTSIGFLDIGFRWGTYADCTESRFKYHPAVIHLYSI
jgi:hypothetical protein